MKFQDIPATILTVRVRRSDNNPTLLQEQPVFSVTASRTRLNEFEIHLKDSVVFVQPVVDADIRRLSSELSTDRAILAQVINRAVDGSIELQIAFFTSDCVEMGDIEVAVDAYVENAVAKLERRRTGLTGQQLFLKLDELCCLRHADSTYFFLIAGPAVDRELEPEPETSEINTEQASEKSAPEQLGEAADNRDAAALPGASPEMPKPKPTRRNSFCVVGDNIRFVATETLLPDGKAIFSVTRLTSNQQRLDRAVRLAKGKLTFVDWTQAGHIQVLARAQMTALTKDEGSYLKKWDEFGNLEGELLLKRARDIGLLQYCDARQNRDGTVTVTVTQASPSALKALENGGVKDVETVSAPPEYLVNEALTFSEFAHLVEQEEQLNKSRSTRVKTRKRSQAQKAPDGDEPQQTRSVEIYTYDAESKALSLKTDRLHSEHGTVILSLSGEVVQIKRRMFARRNILEGRAANPQLGVLIEEKGVVAPVRQPPKIKPLTAFVRHKVFRNPPTVMQEKAIDVALNTPDIALIQGPPGTGKTTVIAAILERLNELTDKRGISRGRVLLTGFQHDAVENMIGRISLNSIPVPKFGKRSGQEDSVDAFERNLERWCGRLASELREKNPQIVEIQQEVGIRNLCYQYAQAPTQTLAGELTRQIALLGVRILGEDIARWAHNLTYALSRQDQIHEKSAELLNAVRLLRVRPGAFADDGPQRATDAIDSVKEFLEKDELALLDRASLWCAEDGCPPFLSTLTDLKRKLLIRLAAPPVFRVEKQNDDVFKLAMAAIERIKTAGRSSLDKKSAALAEFLAELESNPAGMIAAVSDYSFAFAATCQQSVGAPMRTQKRAAGGYGDELLEYDYVIVDEAARVSPRDLLIPAAQGKRIILVGDHRQLPHLVDQTIAEQMEEGAKGQQESDWLRKSMFQYLFSDRLKTLEDNDGITRRVTLNTQYRMHPLLGDFISRNFYERFDAAEQFGSGRPSSDFAHDLSDTDGTPALWLEVPASRGTHVRSGTSWTRQAEATAIAGQLRQWIHSEPGKQLSYGVISFYKAQAELIKEQLTGITEDEERLRVGTVDSFQGMEFDVVFLSMVRTYPTHRQSSDDDRELQARKLFGHLCLYNRLNVSMSRQIRLLVVVGDSALLRNDLADEYIPGLVDFFALCQTDGRILQCR
jgi:hypothetical protein